MWLNMWEKFWAYYLLYGIRLCCYSANLYFYSGFFESFNKAVRISFIAELLVLGFSETCFRFAEKIVRKSYKPRFISEQQAQSLNKEEKSKSLILNQQLYEYRKYSEIVIYQGVVVFAINLILALLLVLVIGGQEVIGALGIALLGLLAAASTFIGAVIEVTTIGGGDNRKGFPLRVVVGLPFLILPILYVVNAFGRFFLR